MLIRLLHPALLACAVVLALAQPTRAQQRSQSARAFVQSPHALAMGDAAAAFATPKSVFFYNPAHLTRLSTERAPITLIGGNASFSAGFSDQLSLYNDRVQPSLKTGATSLTPDQRAALYDDALALGDRRTFASGNVLLPSFAMRHGAFGFGGGLFATTSLRFQVDQTSASVPLVDFFSQADLMMVTAGAMDFASLGVPGLSVGVAGKYTQRYVMLKHELIDAIGSDDNYYVLGTSAMGVDVGVQYDFRPSGVPGTVHLAGVFYDAAGSKMNYSFSGFYDKNADKQEEAVAAELALAQQRLELQRTYRMGAAYTSPRYRGAVSGFGIALDYVQDPGLFRQDGFVDHLRAGAELSVRDAFALRAGVYRSRPTFGVGLRSIFMTVDYAYNYMQEPGLPGGWNHTVEITLGSY